MVKTISAHCPMDKEMTIAVNYIDSSSLENPNQYIKGRYQCEYAESCNGCPLYKSAPQQIRG